MSDGCAVIEVQDETLLLHPERAVVWPARRTLIVADTHFGKSAIFRAHGVAVPDGADARDRERLTRLVQATGARTLLILGDFLHGPLAADSAEARALGAWRAALPVDEVRVVAGNHDRGARRRWQPPVEWLEGSWSAPPFRFAHDGDAARHGGGAFTLSGHVHPVMRLGGRRGSGVRVPVFWWRTQGLVLPSFGEFTGGQLVTAGPSDRLFAVGPDAVVPVRSARNES